MAEQAGGQQKHGQHELVHEVTSQSTHPVALFFKKLMCTLQGGGEGKTSGYCSVLS